MNELIELRHHLHSIAELSGNEQHTAAKIEEFLKRTKPDDLLTGVGGTGIIAKYESGKEGPVILFRCELDALPIPEENNMEYRSKNDETGHKCGHDGHMAIVCGLAQLLSRQGVEKGNVLLLFQPAEETGEGAKRMLEDERFKQLDPDYIFALHNLPGFEKNKIIIRQGTFAAASVGFIARFTGSTSHAAHPEEGRSPALAMAQLVQALSSLPQFCIPLEEGAKATVIHATLGERAFGTSPGYAEVMATLRTYENTLLDTLKQNAVKTTEGLAGTYGLTCETEWTEPFQATVNDGEATTIIKKAAEKNSYDVQVKETPFSWSEDFGHFTGNYKGAMFGLGAGIDQPRLHASDYDFPDDIIETGVRMFSSIIEILVVGHES